MGDCKGCGSSHLKDGTEIACLESALRTALAAQAGAEYDAGLERARADEACAAQTRAKEERDTLADAWMRDIGKLTEERDTLAQLGERLAEAADHACNNSYRLSEYDENVSRAAMEGLEVALSAWTKARGKGE
jgi:hypothetical protein